MSNQDTAIKHDVFMWWGYLCLVKIASGYITTWKPSPELNMSAGEQYKSNMLDPKFAKEFGPTKL